MRFLERSRRLRHNLIALVVALVTLSGVAGAQDIRIFPRVRVTFNGSATAASQEFGGWTLFRTSAITPAVSAAGTARWYFDGTRLRISENGGAYHIIGGGDGTVTSVALTTPGVLFSVTGSPVTTSGTIALALVNQTANTFFAGPTSGGGAAPTFRAIHANDIPTGFITSTMLLDGTILFADIGTNTCGANQIIKRNAGNTAWICSADDTTPGGTAWVTSGNALAATGIFGSTNAFDVSFIANNVQRMVLAQTDGSLRFRNDTGGNAGNIYLEPLSNASAVTTLRDSPRLDFVGRYWDGSANQNFSFFFLNDMSTTAPDGRFRLMRRDSAGAESTVLSADLAGNLYQAAGVFFGAAFNASTHLQMDASTSAVSTTNEGRIRYNGTTDVFEYSVNGGAWTTLTGASTPATITWQVFNAEDGVPPATNFATYDQRNNHGIIVFANAVTETIYFEGTMPEAYDASTITTECRWVGETATTGNVRWSAAYELNSSTGTDIDADSFGTASNITDATSGTSGIISLVTFTHTQAQADAMAAGTRYRLRVQRIGADAADTMASDAQLLSCSVRK